MTMTYAEYLDRCHDGPDEQELLELEAAQQEQDEVDRLLASAPDHVLEDQSQEK